jgi:hypothetical protein
VLQCSSFAIESAPLSASSSMATLPASIPLLLPISGAVCAEVAVHRRSRSSPSSPRISAAYAAQQRVRDPASSAHKLPCRCAMNCVAAFGGHPRKLVVERRPLTTSEPLSNWRESRSPPSPPVLLSVCKCATARQRRSAIGNRQRCS